MNTQKTVLVIGANGGIGHESCVALLRHGWRVRALVRTPRANAQTGIEWFTGDAMNAADVLRAAEGVELIVHAVNPPGYRDWDKLVLPMLDNTIAAAKAVGARIVLPGTIYNFGPDAFPALTEHSPQHPLTRKGEIRVEMERRLAAAAETGAPALILRCGDFFGPQPGNNWLSQGLIKQGAPVRTVQYPGPSEIGHAWAYLPDVGETLARLVDRAGELGRFEVFHFGGYWLDGHEMTATIRRSANNPSIALGRFPWWLVTLAAPFMQTLRELRKMRYLWRAPIKLDDRKLLAFLGAKPYTPIDDAMRATLAGNGCL
ncbi:NAD(P)H-binding protein [Dyella tabacisoli]|uniref:NAD-dependent epimerase/dehydratase family protein n=1 Tax=Dyella tabacisoli TaxID=2282381 RepID=A0A369UJL0_9GAMM|nr:NAD(P)H-binding protein [Dyella tabacisoli]RDD80721.1 NAD-dependent epimerase/dehydratase family protein [Dyella tabacisoli]